MSTLTRNTHTVKAALNLAVVEAAGLPQERPAEVLALSAIPCPAGPVAAELAPPVEVLDPAGDVEADPAGWEPTDADWAEVAELADGATARRFLDTGDRLTLAELADRQADFYRGWGNPAGEMIARHLEELALRIRWVQAETPADYEARAEIVEADARETWFKQGYEEGRRRGLASCACSYNGPLD
jgi:hypothetical protein